MTTKHQSDSYMTALNRALARGDSDRVCELYAVPVSERPTWKPDRRKRSK